MSVIASCKDDWKLRISDLTLCDPNQASNEVILDEITDDWILLVVRVVEYEVPYVWGQGFQLSSSLLSNKSVDVLVEYVTPSDSLRGEIIFVLFEEVYV